MSHIEVNFDEVPDKFEIVPAGIYLCNIDVARKDRNAKGTGDKVVVEMTITEGPMANRKLYDHIGLSGKPISLKQLMKSAGLTPGADGLNLDDLVGKTVEVRTKARTYQDPTTGEHKETTSVAEYISKP